MIKLKNLNLNDTEALLCREALIRTNSLIEAAELLGINRHALRRLITKHDINWQPHVQRHKNWIRNSPISTKSKIVTVSKFSANSARTFQVPIGELYKTWCSQVIGEWLSFKFKTRYTKVNESICFELSNGTIVEIYFREKSKYSSQIYVMHKRLKEKDVVKKKAFWVKILDKLQRQLS